MPPPLTEERLVDLVLLGLGTELERRDSLGFLSKTRLMKMAYSVIEDLSLPVTRGWYQFGWYVYSGELSEERVFALIGRRATDDASVDEVQRLAWTSTQYREIQSVAAKIVEGFRFRSTNEMVRELYATEAPESYRDLYLANWDYLEVVRGLQSAEQTHLAGALWDSVSSRTSSMHGAISQFPDRAIRSLVLDYTSFLELLVIKLDAAGLEPSVALREFVSATAGIYPGGVWRYPASWIFRETVRGPREDEARAQMQAHLGTVSLYARSVDARLREAGNLGFLPTADELDAVVQRARTRLGDRATTAVDNLLTLIDAPEGRSGSVP